MGNDGVVKTRMSGAGSLITELKEGEYDGSPWTNFLLRTDDNNIVRIQLWGVAMSECVAAWGTAEYKGRRCGFRGQLRGIWDEKPTVACGLDDIRMGW